MILRSLCTLAIFLVPEILARAVDIDGIADIFQDRCVSCHHDDDPQGGLSLQNPNGLIAQKLVVVGHAGRSKLVELLESDGGEPEMPQDGESLSESQIALIRSWIDSGAKWPEGRRIEPRHGHDSDWWSLQPIQSAELSRFDSDGENPIDGFIRRKLVQQGLQPSQRADRATLIRRVSYDLTGLPPTPEQIQHFVEDRSPDAYSRLVDRLLESPQYGERWARHWLDVVKYADTCGYDKDKLRPNAWPYRDYVIRSFNDDKPYHRFVSEQVAGDVLYPDTADGILGLGFIAAGPWDFIGHVEVPESKLDGQVARNLDRDDMVSNAINTFCSMTIQCARCHNHKFDPITQRDYYGLQAVFAAVDRADRVYDLDPETVRLRRELMASQRKYESESQRLEDQIRVEGGQELRNLTSQIDKLRKQVVISKDPAFGYHSQIANAADVEKWVSVSFSKPVEVGQIVLHPCHDEFAGIGAGFGFPKRFRVETRVGDADWKVVIDHSQHDYPNPQLSAVSAKLDADVEEIRVLATRLAERKDDYIFALAELEVLGPDGSQVKGDVTVRSLDSIEAPVRWARNNLVDGKWARRKNPGVASELEGVTKKKRLLLKRIVTRERVARRESLKQELASIKDQIAKLPRGKFVYAATTHFTPQGNFKPTNGKPRAIHLLSRGNVDQPRDRVGASLLPLSPDLDAAFDIPEGLPESQRRAKLAQWLVAKEHPLVWRSIVNRVWQYHFGRGIVSTPNDFGRMGDQPTHPELLDWLAIYFRDGGQSFKSLHRLIVTSQTYCQCSDSQAQNESVDRNNRFLWRMNRRRLSAEEIRDSILAVSGCLDLTAGGPGFYLFELEKTAHSPHYEYHKYDPTDASTHRRSIYRFIVRSQPDPWMTTLDCADSSQSTPRRNETLTALQALSLLNNRFNLHMAERFAKRLRSRSSELREQVDYGVKLVTGRSATPAEFEDLLHYGERFGTANMCRLLMNLSEFVYVD